MKWFLVLYFISIGSVGAKLVSVELLSSAQQAVISAKSDYSLMRGETKIAEFKAGSETIIKPSTVTNKGKNYFVGGDYEFRSDGLLIVDGRKYRGLLRVSDGVTIINELELEDYLRSVVASEMPSRWPLEALKAQAVCARTYTLATLKRKPILKSGVADQMYLGYDKEDDKVDKAVKATQGEVLVDSYGNYIDAYYSSSGGNYTASVSDVWGLSPRPYLVPVNDYAQGSSYQSWTREFTDAELQAKLAQYKLNSIENVVVFQRSIEGRATKVQLRGLSELQLPEQHNKPIWHKSPEHSIFADEFKPQATLAVNTRYLTGEELRHKLGLPSTNFQLRREGDKYIFAGTGFGHGIGMTQYGARNMAEAGSDYKQILAHYYHGARLKVGL